MHPTFLQQQLDLLVQRASELLRAPSRAVTVDCLVEEKLLKLARLEQRTGLTGGAPLLEFQGHGRGHRLAAGMELFRLAIGDTIVRFVRVYD
jgi:hypothetical protein